MPETAALQRGLSAMQPEVLSIGSGWNVDVFVGVDELRISADGMNRTTYCLCQARGTVLLQQMTMVCLQD